MIQGYGLTETAAPFTFTRVTDNTIGTVGQPVPGASVRKFLVLPVQFTQDNKGLTPSMKVVRPKVNEVFAREIDKEIYGR